MELPDDATKFPKLPFIIGDAVFLAVAAFLAYTADSPPSTATIVGVVICAGVGVALGVAPFIIDYARAQDQQLTERQNALEALVRTTSSAADQASIAANGLHEIAEITKRNLRTVEDLPGHIQKARVAAQTESGASQSTEIGALQSALNDLSKAQTKAIESHTASLTALQTELASLKRVKSPSAPDLTPQFEKILFMLESLKTEIPSAIKLPDFSEVVAKLSASEKTADPSPAPKKKANVKPRASQEKVIEVVPSLFDEDLPPPPRETAKIEVEETSLDVPEFSDDDAETESSFGPEADDVAEVVPLPAAEIETEAPDDEASVDESEPDSAPLDEEPDPEPSLSSDGLTRLTVTAYIGIGNRLFIRGDGPGLSETEGTPLQFVSIGKWRWETDAASKPFKVTLWKNDQELCTSVGELKIAPGAQVESSANF